MENWYLSQSLLVIAVQGLGDWLKTPMTFFSFLGSEEFYVLVLPILYWCIDAALGLRVGVILLASSGINEALKLIFHMPRPYWISSNVTPLSAETSFGLPSGHAQNTVAIWGILAAYLRKRWVWFVSAAIMILVGFSRIYLGVHFLQDVAAGWALGAILLWAFARLWTQAAEWLKKQTTGRQILMAGIASALILLVGGLPYAKLNHWNLPPEWIANAVRFNNPPPDPVSMKGVLTSAGTLFGLACGLVWMNLRGGYQAKGSAMNRLLRLLIGLAGILLLRYGLGAIFPEGETMIAFGFRYLRYALIGAWVSAGAPFLFVRLKIANPTKDESAF